MAAQREQVAVWKTTRDAAEKAARVRSALLALEKATAATTQARADVTSRPAETRAGDHADLAENLEVLDELRESASSDPAHLTKDHSISAAMSKHVGRVGVTNLSEV